MKCSELWLRKWINPPLTREELCNALTMAGLEVEEAIPVAKQFSDVVVGQILKIEKHPEADRLNVCLVDVGEPSPLQIVCGAQNVKQGMKAPVAKIGAHLPDDLIIKKTNIRGVESFGMLCSANELGVMEESEGLLELPADAPLGNDIRNYFNLDDYVIDISISPNRGDCLSLKGLAREISAITNTPSTPISVSPIASSVQDKLTIEILDQAACPRYIGRILRNVKADAVTPIWLKERLRRSGVRTISPIVDVTNYVMLELGQPMHAFDLNQIKQGIKVRRSKKGEQIALLDGSTQELDHETLVIADHENPLAIAGVMGGMDSSVTLLTRDILLESAYFSPEVVARQRQYYGLTSESAYRFERGVDPTVQQEAVERATQLILEIAGGEAGPSVEKASFEFLPKEKTIFLEHAKITSLLGTFISANEIEHIFSSLQFTFNREKEGWNVRVPSYRFDLLLPQDLIEEVARLFGYDKIPTLPLKADLQVIPEQNNDHSQLIKTAFMNLGYHETISYSFVDKKLQTLLAPNEEVRELVNPITANMTVMRTSMWPGLIENLLYNKSRQQNRIRIFELGTCFITRGEALLQLPRLGGLMMGPAFPEQWGLPTHKADFFDIKSDIENILQLFYPKEECEFKWESHPALHPGKTAAIYHQGKKIGIMGQLHPSILEALDINEPVFAFEVDFDALKKTPKRLQHDISKFPEIRRDLAILINETVPVKDIQDTIRVIAGDWLKDFFIFDVYQGKGISPGFKSIALALILQHPTRTLVDDEVTRLMDQVVTALKEQLGAVLRS